MLGWARFSSAVLIGLVVGTAISAYAQARNYWTVPQELTPIISADRAEGYALGAYDMLDVARFWVSGAQAGGRVDPVRALQERWDCLSVRREGGTKGFVTWARSLWLRSEASAGPAAMLMMVWACGNQ